MEWESCEGNANGPHRGCRPGKTELGMSELAKPRRGWYRQRVNRLWPFVWLAIAIAIGVALAPYIGALVALLVAFLLLCVAVALIDRGRQRFMAAGRRWIAYMDREG